MSTASSVLAPARVTPPTTRFFPILSYRSFPPAALTLLIASASDPLVAAAAAAKHAAAANARNARIDTPSAPAEIHAGG